MSIAFTKLPGLDAARLLAVVEPVLLAHRVDGVELIWKTDRGGMVLELTVERPGSRLPGQGITVDVCADISRDLSAALDVADLIGPRYQLIVGSPGVERSLYSLDDFRRFSGQVAKVKLNGPLEAEGALGKARTLRGTLFGVTDEGLIEMETEYGQLRIPHDRVTEARLVFEIVKAERPGHGPKKGAAGKAKKNPGAKPSLEERNRGAVADAAAHADEKGETPSRDKKVEH